MVDVPSDKVACVELKEVRIRGYCGCSLYRNVIGYDGIVTCYKTMKVSGLRNIYGFCG